MYDYISGRLISKSPTEVTIEAGGVGYRLLIPLSTFEKLPNDGPVKLLASLHVTETEMRLFGFATAAERKAFDLLLLVNGVGPGTALKVLSSCPIQELSRAVIANDAQSLMRVRGIGQKLAQRIVLELKGYMEKLALAEPGLAASPGHKAAVDAVLALIKLGYTRLGAENAVRKAAANVGANAPTDALVREALKYV
jgi:Holliday junction DNA helicase RuvA